MLVSPPAGWTCLDDDGDVPLWASDGHPVYIATADADLLRFLGAAPTRFDHIPPAQFVSR